jgi:hypothetical protein
MWARKEARFGRFLLESRVWMNTSERRARGLND